MLAGVLAAFLLAAVSGVQAVTLKADVSVGGVKGSVTFTQASPGGAVTLAFILDGPNAGKVNTWQLRTHRLNYDVTDQCSEQNLGTRFLENVSGSVTGGNVSGFDLSGVNSIEGRSIVFLGSSSQEIACATVESGSEYVTAAAVFRSKVLGQVTFRQLKSTAAALTQVASDLFYDGSQATGVDLEWRIGSAGTSGDCATVGAAYDPSGATGPCSTTQQSNCAVGDLSRKLGSVGVGVEKGTRRKTTVDLNLPLSGTSSVDGKTLLLYTGTQPVACAVIRVVEPRTGVATFDNDAVTGNVTFMQPSPLDPVTTKVHLVNLRNKAGGYHIHEWPVPQRLMADQELCGASSVGGHFNPFGVVYVANSPGAANSTEDMYEVGDLSKKYGMLDGIDTLTRTYKDWNLQLFGVHSILGRSLVIHYASLGSPRWVCVNIHDTAALSVAMATFTSPVIGYVMLQQRQGEEFAETFVYTRLDYGDGSNQATTEHTWSAHVNPVGDGDVSTQCAATGDRFNPYNVSSANYAAQCSPTNQLRCNAGDLGGKHGALSVRKSNATVAISSFTDVNLPLFGRNSIVGKSIVLMRASGSTARLACADVINVMPRNAKVSNWGNVSYGSVSFMQISGVIQRPTEITFDLNKLPTGEPIEYLIRERPVDSLSTGRCQNIGRTYNPFGITSDNRGSTKDKIEVGDLSGKFGQAGTDSELRQSATDPSLDLFGLRSVVGRAMTLKASRTWYVCGDIKDTAVSGGMMVEAEAVFTGDVTGKIMMSQYIYPGGSMSDTTVVVDLRKASGLQTQNHNWHTHELPVGVDTEDKPCNSTGGHFNPFIDATAHYDECGPANPLRCEIGDQSNKLGTYNMDSGQMVATDIYLPLAGKYGVIGRSIVVHAPERGAPRIACADIMPTSLTNTFFVRVNMAPAQFSSLVMRQKVANTLGVGTYDVVVSTIGPDQGCTGVRIYFLGLNGSNSRQKFTDMMHSDNMKSSMGEYMPVTATCCGAHLVTSLVLLLTSFILGHPLSLS